MLPRNVVHTRRQLQLECSKTLRCYVRRLQDGCDLLGQVKEGVITQSKRHVIFAHRKRELLAQAAYTKARKRLWSFLTDSEPRWPDK
jgi:hypothetical protein